MAIEQQAERCWVLAGQVEGRHWPTHEAALESAEADEIEQLPAACWVATCGDCGEPLGDDDQFSQLHFDDRESLLALAADYDWTLAGDDFRCEEDAVATDA